MEDAAGDDPPPSYEQQTTRRVETREDSPHMEELKETSVCLLIIEYETAKPKPPVKPKSDISTARAPTPGKADGKKAAGQPTAPSGSESAIAKSACPRPPRDT